MEDRTIEKSREKSSMIICTSASKPTAIKHGPLDYDNPIVTRSTGQAFFPQMKRHQSVNTCSIEPGQYQHAKLVLPAEVSGSYPLWQPFWFHHQLEATNFFTTSSQFWAFTLTLAPASNATARAVVSARDKNNPCIIVKRSWEHISLCREQKFSIQITGITECK